MRRTALSSRLMKEREVETLGGSESEAEGMRGSVCESTLDIIVEQEEGQAM